LPCFDQNPLYFHIDVNSAFLSWTAVDLLNHGADYDLRMIPSIIGGDQSNRHGIVLAKSVPAKKYHIETAEPIVDALKKCPDLVIMPPSTNVYKESSRKLMSLLSTYSPVLEQLSIDECFLDFSMAISDYESPIAAATIIKDTVYKEFGFTVNVGISSKKILAKMASDFQKPNQVHTLFPDEIPRKMWPLPVSDLYMCGKSACSVLRKLGILTIGDLAKSDPSILSAHLKSHGQMLWEFANGIDDRKISSEHAPAKGIGTSTTLPSDISSIEEALPVLLKLSDKVSERLRHSDKLANMINVEIKYADFTSNSRQMQLDTPTNTASAIYQFSCILYKQLWNGNPVRLIGIRSSKLQDYSEPVQLTLADILVDTPTSDKQRQLEAAIDSIRTKYGSDSIKRASMVHKADKK